MNYNAIHTELKKHGFTWEVVAKSLGKSASTVMNVAARRAQGRSIAVGLAALLDKDVTEVFPDISQYHEPSRKTVREENIAKAQERLKAAGLDRHCA